MEILLVAVQLSHFERQGKHRLKSGYRWIVVESGSESSCADFYFHFCSRCRVAVVVFSFSDVAWLSRHGLVHEMEVAVIPTATSGMISSCFTKCDSFRCWT